MPEVIIAGPEGRLEGFYHPSEEPNAPIALVLHAHPKGGGHMNAKPITTTYDLFKRRGYSVCRFNLRGVGGSQGEFDQGQGELQDAATVLDWLQSMNTNAPFCWVAGHSFGAWLGMQLLMRRPEVAGFISMAPPMNMYDFGFLAPCPASGLFIYGSADRICPPEEIELIAERIRIQKGTLLSHTIVQGAGHLFDDHIDELIAEIDTYMNYRENGTLDPSMVEYMKTHRRGRR